MAFGSLWSEMAHRLAPVAWVVVILAGCGGEATSTADADLLQHLQGLGLAPLAAPPPQDSAKVALGQALFFDKILSGPKDISCASCHQPALATVDAGSLAKGTGSTGLGAERQGQNKPRLLPRNTVDLFNRGDPRFTTFFLDGRVEKRLVEAEDGPQVAYRTPPFTHAVDISGMEPLLAAASLFPTVLADEMKGGVDEHGKNNELSVVEEQDMHLLWERITARLAAIPAYAEAFRRVYPEAREIGYRQVGDALAAFQIAAFPAVDTAFDRFLAGDLTAMSESQKAGAWLFYGKAGCADCHTGNLFSDFKHHNLGVPQIGPGFGYGVIEDFGRSAVTDLPEDRFAYRTPPLRNVALTSPYFHNGSFKDLREVIAHHLDPETSHKKFQASEIPADIAPITRFEQLNRNVLFNLDPKVSTPQSLSEAEITALVDFLNALTDRHVGQLEKWVPALVPSGLPVDRYTGK